jgi:hypothetical protein
VRIGLAAGASVALLLGAVAYAPVAGATPNETAPHSAAVHLDNGGVDHGDNGKPQRPGGGGSGGSTSNGINYHGGPVMNNPTNVYIIWYGNWSGDSATMILPTMLNNIGASPYFHIQSTYTDSLHRPVSSSVTVAKQTTDAYSQGSKNLSDSQIASIVSTALNNKSLPADPNGVYFVLTSTDVTKSGFLSQYCGWHTDGNYGTTNIKYSFVGDPGANGACSVQTSVSPNGNVGADAMASVVAHELDEATNDPDLNAWYDQRGQESADKCAWTFGNTYAANGAQANMNLGGLNFLIQRNWVNASGGYCSLSY